MCLNSKNKNSIKHLNISSSQIQDRRSEMDVSCFPNGKIHDYVPFYFSTKNSMLLSIVNSKNIDQSNIIYFAISIDKILDKNVIFTNSSANAIIPPNFYNDPINLDQLDWEIIDSKKWKFTDKEKQKKMAEVLIFNKVPLNWITHIVVWNDSIKKQVKEIYESSNLNCPKIVNDGFNNKYYWFTKFMFNGRDCETLVTGPKELKKIFNFIQKYIIEERKGAINFKFNNITDTIISLNKDFCSIEEMKNIYKLETDNDIHTENVSDHTLKVVNNLNDNQYFKMLNQHQKEIVTLAAYLHDIGKGPKSKWQSGKQPNYPDHPVDSLKQICRILSQDIRELSSDDIRKICLLVGYHDLIGDIITNGRDIKQLFDLDITKDELNMLIALSLCDIKAIRLDWYRNVKLKVSKIFEDFKIN